VKRLFDVMLAALGLAIASPLLLVVALAIWLQDFRSPFYVGVRAGRGGRPFRMVKFRSMVVRAEASGVDSTAGDDPRITAVGRLVRRFKLDELPQLWNVVWGEMSFVGPRPNVPRETALYTAEEQGLLGVRPGITDLASIVFSDESEILRGSDDPDLRYNQLIRPWKSRLGLLYVRHAGKVALDVRLIWITLYSAVRRQEALQRVARIVRELGGGEELAEVATRTQPLRAAPPPGSDQVVASRY
jgi:lipopolysaccharide/colanic/teichoic acid biosynthesis glycosyltransferase